MLDINVYRIDSPSTVGDMVKLQAEASVSLTQSSGFCNGESKELETEEHQNSTPGCFQN